MFLKKIRDVIKFKERADFFIPEFEPVSVKLRMFSYRLSFEECMRIARSKKAEYVDYTIYMCHEWCMTEELVGDRLRKSMDLNDKEYYYVKEEVIKALDKYRISKQ